MINYVTCSHNWWFKSFPHGDLPVPAHSRLVHNMMQGLASCVASRRKRVSKDRFLVYPCVALHCVAACLQYDCTTQCNATQDLASYCEPVFTHYLYIRRMRSCTTVCSIFWRMTRSLSVSPLVPSRQCWGRWPHLPSACIHIFIQSTSTYTYMYMYIHVHYRSGNKYVHVCI